MFRLGISFSSSLEFIKLTGVKDESKIFTLTSEIMPGLRRDLQVAAFFVFLYMFQGFAFGTHHTVTLYLKNNGFDYADIAIMVSVSQSIRGADINHGLDPFGIALFAQTLSRHFVRFTLAARSWPTQNVGNCWPFDYGGRVFCSLCLF